MSTMQFPVSGLHLIKAEFNDMGDILALFAHTNPNNWGQGGGGDGGGEGKKGVGT